MLYEFAMTPELFGAPFAACNRRAEDILPELLRKIAENGMLANLNKDRWSQDVEERLTTLSESSPILKDKIFTCLKVLDDRHRLVRHPKSRSGNPRTDQDWLNLVFESHEKIRFDAIISSKELMEDSGRKCDEFVDVLGSLELPLWGKRTLSLAKTEDWYRRALRPVLRHARSLTLVDPYMSTDKRYFRTVELCSELLGKRVHDGRLEGRIRIHALIKNQKPGYKEVSTYLDSWEEKLASLRDKYGHRFQVFLWDKKKIDSESMHDRFILTDQCGISVPKGLDCRGGGTDWNLLDDDARQRLETDWSLLDDDARQRREADYDPDTSPFEFVKSRIVESP